jgi:hypothetical protein
MFSVTSLGASRGWSATTPLRSKPRSDDACGAPLAWHDKKESVSLESYCMSKYSTCDAFVTAASTGKSYQ